MGFAEGIPLSTIALAATGIILLGAGIGIGYWLSQLSVNARLAEADEVQDKFDTYRRQVTEHFGRTAEHFQSIGQQYRELYEHMASGAESLLDSQVVEEKLDFKPIAADEPAQASAADEAEPPKDYVEAETAEADAEVVAEADSVAVAESVDDETSTAEPVEAAMVDETGETGDSDEPPPPAGDEAEAPRTIH